MKTFKIQALCADTKLWDVMRCLEDAKCVGILAQPLHEEHAKTQVNGTAEGSIVDAVLQLVRSAPGAIKASDVREALQAQNGYRGRPHGALFTLKKRKLIRAIGGGRYVATKREVA